MDYFRQPISVRADQLTMRKWTARTTLTGRTSFAATTCHPGLWPRSSEFVCHLKVGFLLSFMALFSLCTMHIGLICHTPLSSPRCQHHLQLRQLSLLQSPTSSPQFPPVPLLFFVSPTSAPPPPPPPPPPPKGSCRISYCPQRWRYDPNTCT